MSIVVGFWFFLGCMAELTLVNGMNIRRITRGDTFVCRLKKGLWREETPEGFRAHKYVKGPDGEYKRDPNFVGENAWDDSENEPLDKLVEEGNLNDEEKAELLGILNENRSARGLPPLNSEFKEERPENDSLDNSNDLIAGQFLDYKSYALKTHMESLVVNSMS